MSAEQEAPKEAPERYSYTLMERAENCLLSAKLSREIQSGGPAMMLGRLFHDAAAGYLSAHFQGADQTEATAAARSAMERSDSPLSMADFYQAESLLAPWEHALLLRKDPLLHLIEQPYEHQIGGYRLSARIDLIQLYEEHGQLVCQIDDHKTGYLLPSQEDFARKMQVFLYAWHVAQEISDITIFDVGEIYARWGVRRFTVFGPNQFADLETYLEVAARRLQSAWQNDDFPATPGAHCANCPAPEWCPLVETAPVLTTENAAREVLGEIVKAEARAKALKGLLKGYVGEHGEVHSGGMVAKLSHSTRESLDKDGLRQSFGDIDQFVKRSDYTRFSVQKESEP